MIARAIFHADYDEDESWDGCPDLHPVYIKMADAVIDALEKMEVSVEMYKAWCAVYDEDQHPSKECQDTWKAFVGAMRDE